MICLRDVIMQVS